MPDAKADALAAARRGLFELYREQNTRVWIEATGVSMLPSIRTGTWLLVEFGTEAIAVGEIALFRRGETMVAHRVVRRGAGGVLIFKGDARIDFDTPVPATDVLGTVRALRDGPEGARVTPLAADRRAVRQARISAFTGDAVAFTRRLPGVLRRPALSLIERSRRAIVARGPGTSTRR